MTFLRVDGTNCTLPVEKFVTPVTDLSKWNIKFNLEVESIHKNAILRNYS